MSITMKRVRSPSIQIVRKVRRMFRLDLSQEERDMREIRKRLDSFTKPPASFSREMRKDILSYSGFLKSYGSWLSRHGSHDDFRSFHSLVSRVTETDESAPDMVLAGKAIRIAHSRKNDSRVLRAMDLLCIKVKDKLEFKNCLFCIFYSLQIAENGGGGQETAMSMADAALSSLTSSQSITLAMECIPKTMEKCAGAAAILAFRPCLREISSGILAGSRPHIDIYIYGANANHKLASALMPDNADSFILSLLECAK